jgi:hypothetical protein
MCNGNSNWFDEPEIETKWLVYGLITSDDNAGFVGKPKSGKSTSIRNLAAAVVVGRPFLGRNVELPEHSGKVIYVHLDRKDHKHQVCSELRNLGITEDDAERLRLFTEKDIPKNLSFEDRCGWLAEQVAEFNPHIVMIDLLFHFIKLEKGVNDYNNVLDAIAKLQDSLSKVGYKGALLMSLHARKAMSEDVADNTLGSTGINGSMSTSIYFKHDKKEGIYTVESEQTHRDPSLGELNETLVERDSQTGELSLGLTLGAVKHEEKKDLWNVRRNKLLLHIMLNPGKTNEELATELKMSKKTVQPLLVSLAEDNLIDSVGEGKKGDPRKWFEHVATSTTEAALPLVPFCPLGGIVAAEPLVEQKVQEGPHA